MRIDIIGSSASGKSTLAHAISEKLSIPHIHLDRFWFESGGRQGSHDTPNLEEVRASVRVKALEILKEDSWVSDGIYMHIQPEIASRADVIIFLDIPLVTRLFNHAKRMCSPSTRHQELSFWDDLRFFPEIVKRTFKNEPKFEKILKEYGNKVIILRSKKQIREYLDTLVRDSATVTNSLCS